MFDEAWAMPLPGWAPGSSFTQPIPAPITDPDTPPLVQLPCVSIEYLPLILGALDQLRNPSTWDPSLTDSQRWLALQRIDQLRCIIGGAINMPCGSSVPPGVGPGGTQQACNIAGFLANVLIRQVVDQAVQSIQQNQSILGFTVTVMRFLSGLFPLTFFAISAFQQLYNYISGHTLTDFTDAVDDPFLVGNLACAIYTAISADGQITASNFPTVVANVGAVPYIHADVITAIVNYLNSLGAAGVMSSQPAGVLADYDCSGCGGGPATGPVGLPPSRQIGRLLLTILAGASDAVQLITFPDGGWPSAPALLTAGDNEDLIVSVEAVTPTTAQLRITSAVPVTADTSANVVWSAELGRNQ